MECLTPSNPNRCARPDNDGGLTARGQRRAKARRAVLTADQTRSLDLMARTARLRYQNGISIYLEVLDASFSFDGVIGAFALTHNLFIIAIGLGIGAMYVRSMTIMLVERGTLAEYRFLEHGAFYAIIALSVIMFVQPLMHIPEVITGLVGAVV